MKVVVQRVARAEVRVDGRVVGRIQVGSAVLVGVAQGDSAADAEYLARKVTELRIFDDAEGQMNRCVTDVGGSILAVSQFTLLADCRKGRRPSFVSAAPPDPARKLFDHFVDSIRGSGVDVQTGRFGAAMELELVNDGPVTILLDSRP